MNETWETNWRESSINLATLMVLSEMRELLWEPSQREMHINANLTK